MTDFPYEEQGGDFAPFFYIDDITMWRMTMGTDIHARIAELAGHIAPRITEIRHNIHRHPEPKFKEHRTAGLVEAFLDEIGMKHERCTETGVVGHIGTGGGHVVALRSEMDALEMPDLSGLPYASENKGCAHACGHDGHISVLMGTAWVLKQLEQELPGVAKLLWQPAEEGGAGAEKMIQAGVLTNPAPEAIFAVHGWPGLDVGRLAYRFGPAMASVDNFEITIRGKGAHGAMPHRGVDPVAIAARVIDGVQHIPSRMIDPLRSLVITIGTLHGGSAVNVIPDEVVMGGTIRTLDPDTRSAIPPLLKKMTADTALASGGEGIAVITEGYPATINDIKATEFARDTLIESFGADALESIGDPSMGGEDFAYYLEKIPGSFLHLGVGERPSLHNSAYDFNDAAIPFGIRAMAGMAVRFMETGLDG